jgi:hypothetical protein
MDNLGWVPEMTSFLLLVIVALLCWIIPPVRIFLMGAFLVIRWEHDHRFLPHPWYGSRAFDWRSFDLDPANRKKLKRFVRHGGTLASGLNLESIERGA